MQGDLGQPEVHSRKTEEAISFVASPSATNDESFGELSFSTAEANSDFADELLRIHEYERQRMGQELHDSAGQLLVSLQLSVAHLRQVEKDNGHQDLIEEIQGTIRQIDQQIRALAFLHYPAELHDRGLGLALQSLTLGFGRRTGILTTFKATGNFAAINDASATALLRVAQEALVNVHRHARASNADVVIKRLRHSIELNISDDGVGLPAGMEPGKSRGIGLQGMRHRIERIGGSMEFMQLSPGTRITATIPIAA